ncbi:MAG: flagellar basal-body rod protein FlgF [Alphaproteobacteria bacterium]|nr:flagellar basal-body rod protein FlgF [Alphaproteobacteria bacterium]
MDNGIYIALSRQMGLFREMNATANNIANSDTAGYNAEKIMFEDYLVKGGSGPKHAYVHDVASYRDTSEGPMKMTGNPMDMAISGPAYFMVDTPLGVRYTRAGNFQIDLDGNMVTKEGYTVLDDGGAPIVFLPEDGEVSIGEAGNISVNGEARGNIAMMEFDNPQMLERLNATMFKSDAPGRPATESRMLHGMIEGSNVQPVMELTRMMTVTRSVSSTAKLIEAQYELQRKTSNTWARNE